MLIYGVSGIFAHKKTIKQFLQPMIEQVLRGGGGGVWMCRYFWVSFSELPHFCVGFSPMPFFGSILPIFAYFFFAVYYVYIIKKSNSVLGTEFS